MVIYCVSDSSLHCALSLPPDSLFPLLSSHRDMSTDDNIIPLQPPPGDFAGYIFDCDGTLAETMHLHYQSWVHAVRLQVGQFDMEWDFFCSMGGMSTGDTIAVLNKLHGFSLNQEKLLQDVEDFLDDRLETALPRREVIALAREVAKKGIPLSVASGGFRKYVERTLKSIGVMDLFPIVVANEDVPRVKPAPDLFLLAAQKMGVPPEKCLVIEDSPKGRDAADAAGMTCLLIDPK